MRAETFLRYTMGYFALRPTHYVTIQSPADITTESPADYSQGHAYVAWVLEQHTVDGDVFAQDFFQRRLFSPITVKLAKKMEHPITVKLAKNWSI